MKRRIFIAAVLSVILGSCWLTCNAQDVVNRRSSAAATPLAFVSASDSSTDDGPSTAVLLTITTKTNKLLLAKCASVSSSDVLWDSVVCTTNGKAFTLLDTSNTPDKITAGIWYLLDADIPASGQITVKGYTNQAWPDLIMGVEFYENAAQEAPGNFTTTYDVADTSTTISVDGVAMRWDMTEVGWYIHMGCTITGATSGSITTDLFALQSPDVSIAAYAGQTEAWKEVPVIDINGGGSYK